MPSLYPLSFCLCFLLRPFLGRDGSVQDPVLASALGTGLAGARARAALIRPGPNVPAVPSAAC